MSLAAITGDQETTLPEPGAKARAAGAARGCERGSGEEGTDMERNRQCPQRDPVPLVMTPSTKSLVLF